MNDLAPTSLDETPRRPRFVEGGRISSDELNRLDLLIAELFRSLTELVERVDRIEQRLDAPRRPKPKKLPIAGEVADGEVRLWR